MARSRRPAILPQVQHPIADALAWIQPHALLFAVALPPLIRLVGHLIPEEVFMVVIGALAARAPSSGRAAVLLVAVTTSQFMVDQATYLAGCWLRPRLARWPRISSRLSQVTGALERSPGALFGLIPARVLPLGRGAWLAGCGVVGVRWRRFARFDLAANLANVAFWSGLGWWFSGNLARLELSAELGRRIAEWTGVTLVLAVALALTWRRLPDLLPATVRTAFGAGERAGDTSSRRDRPRPR